MAQFTLTIPDGVLDRVLDAVTATYGWTSESGLTKAQFARQQLARWVREIVKAHEANLAAEAARLAAASTADNDTSGVS